MITHPFLNITPVNESLASIALERLLGVIDLSTDTAAGLLNLASFDVDGALDPDLHSFVLSDTFISLLERQTSISGGSHQLFCPAAFTSALSNYVTSFPEQAASLLSNSYTVRE